MLPFGGLSLHAYILIDAIYIYIDQLTVVAHSARAVAAVARITMLLSSYWMQITTMFGSKKIFAQTLDKKNQINCNLDRRVKCPKTITVLNELLSAI